MKTNYIKRLLVFGIILGLISCTSDFDNINKNPNAGESINEIYYLTKVITTTAYQYQEDAYMSKPACACRYITKLRNNGDDLLTWTAEGWDNYYACLSTNKTLYDQAEADGAEQYMALSRILEVFNFEYITELWGDIPYSEALHSKDQGIIYPKYDTQETVYPDLIKKLDEANTTLKNTSLSIDGTADVMFKGNVLKWRKFANSLRLRMLLRESKKVSTAISEIQKMVNDQNTYPIMSNNDDNAEIPYVNTYLWPGGPTKAGSLTDPTKEFIKRRPSKEIIDFMVERNDPRLPILFDKVSDISASTVDKNDYVGCPISLTSPYIYNGGDTQISTLNKDIFYQDMNSQVKASMMIYPEVCFILAEVTQQKNVAVPGETAKSLYEKGIAAALNYWGVNSSDINTYLKQKNVVYDGSLKQLIGQKWAALFIKGAEGWFDYRRTNDVLEFNKQIIGESAGQLYLPYRYIYPDGERAQNNNQYLTAIKVFGDDNINTKMWLIK